MIDFTPGARAEAFRLEVREFVREMVTPELLERVRRSGTAHDSVFHRTLADRGWIAPGWPLELGGQGRDAFELAAFFGELSLAGAPMDGHRTTMLVSNVIRHLGTDEQRRLLEGVLAGDTLFALGFTEPDAGSDVAAAATRAVRDGETWVVTGQKMFTTLASEADQVFLLARTDLDAPKHAGLTTFLVRLDTPGIEIQPVWTLDGARTNVTFFNDVRVPDTARVGEANDGWAVMRVALTYERAGGYGSHIKKLLRTTMETLKDPSRRSSLADPLVRARLARTAIEIEVSELLDLRTNWLEASGSVPGVEAAMVKLFSTEAYVAASGRLLDLLGPDGQRGLGDPAAPAGGELEHTFRHAVATTIYAGTSEIQRGIIARQRLGLPRAH